MINNPSRQLRIFISSTFQDMQLEREELIKHVFPRLKQIARERFVDITEIDLRWGITHEQVNSGETLKICLDEINKCKDSPIFFIGILGERYGWIPNNIDSKIFIDSRYQWLNNFKDKSVTELEIQYAVLENPSKNQKSFFYLRDEKLSKDLSVNIIDNDNAIEKQNILKDKIRKNTTVSLDGYKSIKDFGESVFQDIKKELDSLYPNENIPSQIEQTKIVHSQFAQSKKKLYIKNDLVFKDIDNFFNSEKSYLTIQAESGLGKSSLIANYIDHYKGDNPNTYIIEHYIGGAGEYSANLTFVLFRILEEIKEKYKLSTELPKHEDMLDEFSIWLYNVPKDEEIAIFLDAVDQLNEEEPKILRWLPKVLPENMKIVLSSIDNLDIKNGQQLKLQPLSTNEQNCIISNYLEQYSKTLTSTQLNKILNNSKVNNTLYLKALLYELKIHGDFETIDNKIDMLLQYNSLEELFISILKRIEKDYDKNNVFKDIVSLIWCSRDGLSEEEILEIITVIPIEEQQLYINTGNHLSLTNLELSHILLGLEEHIIYKEGKINFFHKYINKAIKDNYLKDGDSINNYRLKIANYFDKQDKDMDNIVRIARELPYQLYHCKKETRLLDTISNVKIFSISQDDNWQLEILKYYLSINSIKNKENIYLKNIMHNLQYHDLENIYLSNYICIFINNFFEHINTEEIYLNIIEHMEKLLGNESIELLGPMSNLANRYAVVQDYNNSEELYIKTIELSKKKLGINNINTLSYQNDVGLLYMHVGKYDKAMNIFEYILKYRMKYFENQHEDISESLNNLGSLYMELSQYEKVEAIMKKSLLLSQKYLGKYYPKTINIMNNLGLYYYNIEQYDTAESIFNESLLLSEKLLGLNHRLTFSIISNLALLNQDKGDFKKAISYYETCSSISKIIFSLKDKNRLTMLNNLAFLYSEIGEENKAINLFNDILLDLSKTSLNKRGPLILKSMFNLASTYNKVKDYSNAKYFYDKSYELCKEILNEDHPNRITIMHDVESFYQEIYDTAPNKDDIYNVSKSVNKTFTSLEEYEANSRKKLYFPNRNNNHNEKKDLFRITDLINKGLSKLDNLFKK